MDIFINKKVWNTFDDVQKEEYQKEVFNYYRSNGFPFYPTNQHFRDNEFKKLMNFNGEILIDKKLKQTMHGLNLAWSYFPNSWEISCNDLLTPMEVFNNDDKFKKVIEKRMRMGDNMSDAGIRKMLKIFTGTQSVSNFRPTSACALYNYFATDGIVWDMSCGFGGRLFGFIKSKAKKYIGTEPASKIYQGLIKIKEDYGNKEIELYQCGSEDFIPDENSLDFCFTSPPYFDCEKYSDENTQSYIKFPSQHLWVEGFLKKTFENCYHGLKKGKIMAINIANTKTFINLEDKAIEKAEECGFTYVDKFYYLLSSLSKKSTFKYEPIFIFKK